MLVHKKLSPMEKAKLPRNRRLECVRKKLSPKVAKLQRKKKRPTIFADLEKLFTSRCLQGPMAHRKFTSARPCRKFHITLLASRPCTRPRCLHSKSNNMSRRQAWMCEKWRWTLTFEFSGHIRMLTTLVDLWPTKSKEERSTWVAAIGGAFSLL